MLAELEDAEQAQHQHADFSVEDNKEKNIQKNLTHLPKAFTETNNLLTQQKHAEFSRSTKQQTSAKNKTKDAIHQPVTDKQDKQKNFPRAGTRVCFEFSSSWGSEHHIGLTEVIILPMQNLYYVYNSKRYL